MVTLARTKYLGVDLGAGNMKVVGAAGGVVLPSQAATATGDLLAQAAGLKAGEPPLLVRLNGHAYYVGLGAHDWGRPVENLADARFTGAPETRALLYGALTRYARLHNRGLLEPGYHLVVGLPQSAVDAEAVSGVRGWLRGRQRWHYNLSPDKDGGELKHDMDVADVLVTSQAAGALFDYFLDDAGQYIKERKGLFKREVGIVSVGMSTVELLVVENGRAVQRFGGSYTSGVRRLLDLVDPQGLYTRGELDTKLRAGRLDVGEMVPVWASEVLGHIENKWGKAGKRFGVTIVVGGGALLLEQGLLSAFGGKAFVPDEPVLAIARGLYKFGLQKESRKRGPKTGL